MENERKKTCNSSSQWKDKAEVVDEQESKPDPKPPRTPSAPDHLRVNLDAFYEWVVIFPIRIRMRRRLEGRGILSCRSNGRPTSPINVISSAYINVFNSNVSAPSSNPSTLKK